MADRIIFLGTGIDDYIANIIQAQLLFLESTDPKKDIDRLQREMDQARTDAANAGKKVPTEVIYEKPSGQSLEAVVASAVTLLVVALALLFANRAPKEQVTAIAAGSVGANAGLLVGYAVGRRRNG